MGSVAYLVEPVLATVTDIDYLDALRSQTRIEHITLAQLGLEVGATSKHETGYVDLVIRDEVLNRQLGDLPNVIVALLVTKTRETQGGLTTSTVLLGKVYSNSVQYVKMVTCATTNIALTCAIPCACYQREHQKGHRYHR